MADSKITALTAISTVDPTADPLVIVDVSDTSMAASGTTKKGTINQLLGAGGTATLASATITGDLTVATNTLKTTSGNVGIGTVTPDIFGRFYTRNIGFNSSGTTGLQINGGTGGYGAIDLGAAGVRTFGISASAVDAQITTVTNIPLLFNINGATKMTLNTAGNLAFLSGQGIDFSATAGTGTSELLNDYEEGTFVPTVRGSTTSGTGTYTTQFGRYTKVGRLVTVSVTLVWTAHTGTGNLQFAGLPFASANTASAYDGIAIAYQSSISSAANTVLYGLVEFGSTVVTMTATPVGGGGYGLVALDTAGEIAFTATYTV